MALSRITRGGPQRFGLASRGALFSDVQPRLEAFCGKDATAWPTPPGNTPPPAGILQQLLSPNRTFICRICVLPILAGLTPPGRVWSSPHFIFVTLAIRRRAPRASSLYCPDGTHTFSQLALALLLPCFCRSQDSSALRLLIDPSQRTWFSRSSRGLLSCYRSFS